MFDFLAPNIRRIMGKSDLPRLEEIRLRIYQPLSVRSAGRCLFLDGLGRRSSFQDAYRVSPDDIARTVQILTNNSWYAWEDEIRGGYLTVPGGHRVGLCGRAVVEGTKVKTIKSISSLSIRIAREVLGAADEIINVVCPPGKSLIQSTLIVSPPGAGKTTLLRDLARQISYRGFQVVIVDERSEIAACYQGAPQLDVGPQTDVLDGYPKTEGISIAVRALAPQLVITDEIGHPDDATALAELARCGVGVISSCHGSSINQIRARRWVAESLDVFQTAVILSHRQGPGTIERVLSLK